MSAAPLLDELERRQSIADTLEQHFKANVGRWISIGELSKMVGSAFGSRIRCDLKPKRGMNIVWNKQNGAKSAYRYLPYSPLGPDATEPMREVTLFNLSDRQERR